MDAIKPKRMNGKLNDLVHPLIVSKCMRFDTNDIHFVIPISHSLPISNEMSMIKFVASAHLKGLIMDIWGNIDHQHEAFKCV